MKKKDTTAPATKQDIGILMEMIGDVMQKVEAMGYTVQKVEQKVEAMEDVVTDSEDRITDKVVKKVLPHMDLLFENLRADVLDARKDQVAQHEDTLKNHGQRIVTLERVVRV